MSFLPGTFTAIPNPMMIPFMGAQTYYMAKLFGLGMQGEKMLMKSHSDPRAQSEIRSYMHQEAAKIDGETLELFNNSLRTFRSMIPTLSNEMFQYFRMLVDIARGVVTQNPVTAGIPVANPQDFTNQPNPLAELLKFFNNPVGSLIPNAAADTGDGSFTLKNPPDDFLSPSQSPPGQTPGINQAYNEMQRRIAEQKASQESVHLANVKASAAREAENVRIASLKKKLPSDPRTILSKIKDLKSQIAVTSNQMIQIKRTMSTRAGVANNQSATYNQLLNRLNSLNQQLSSIVSTYDLTGVKI